MMVDDEIKLYLRLILDHSRDCHEQACPSNALLQEVCSMLREKIFPGAAVPPVCIQTPAPQPCTEQEDGRTGAAAVKA